MKSSVKVTLDSSLPDFQAISDILCWWTYSNREYTSLEFVQREDGKIVAIAHKPDGTADAWVSSGTLW